MAKINMRAKKISIESIVRRVWLVMVGFYSFCLPGICQTKEVSGLQMDSSILHLADPTIFHYKNTYYLYGTVEGNAGKGFLAYTSPDLKNWKLSEKNDGYALKKGEAFGRSGFWAPQVFFTGINFIWLM